MLTESSPESWPKFGGRKTRRAKALHRIDFVYIFPIN